MDADFVARIEDALDLYAEPPDPLRPVVCIDETLKQLVEDVKTPLPPLPGSTETYDHHDRRDGSANLFVATRSGATSRSQNGRRTPTSPSASAISSMCTTPKPR